MCLLLLPETSNWGPGEHTVSCLLLLTQSANNMLTYSHEALPVLRALLFILCWRYLSPIRTERRECMWTHCTCMWTFGNTSWTVFTLYLLPITSISQARRSQSMQSCCCLSRSGASCPDRGPSRDIPERSCLNRARKSWVFWTPFNDLQSYLTWVWYASTS